MVTKPGSHLRTDDAPLVQGWRRNATDITFGPYRSHRGHMTDAPELIGWAVAAVVSIRRDEGSPSVWQKTAMRFELTATAYGRLWRGFWGHCRWETPDTRVVCGP